MRIALSVLLLLVALTARAELAVVELTAGMHLIRAELADTFATRMQGLMHRQKLGQNAGMVFVFDEPGIQCMWMKNTLIPLSVAFLDDSGRIINIADMRPQTEDTHCAARPARYALEMNRGWFAERGIKPGGRLRGVEKLAPRRQ
ncbi:MAG: DUF192 domain-containing protein [Betaproteobacteria bacterium]|nr:DUF192 domain-containing protein [Betaproteobacteria bacterium]